MERHIPRYRLRPVAVERDRFLRNRIQPEERAVKIALRAEPPHGNVLILGPQAAIRQDRVVIALERRIHEEVACLHCGAGVCQAISKGRARWGRRRKVHGCGLRGIDTHGIVAAGKLQRQAVDRILEDGAGAARQAAVGDPVRLITRNVAAIVRVLRDAHLNGRVAKPEAAPKDGDLGVASKRHIGSPV